jgi:cytochrome-b5 reductase
LKPILFAIGAIGIGVGVYRYTQQKPGSAEPAKERAKVFLGGDQGWVNLKLADVEDLSPNTKRLRFEFPDKEAVSGMKVACKSSSLEESLENALCLLERTGSCSPHQIQA